MPILQNSLQKNLRLARIDVMQKFLQRLKPMEKPENLKGLRLRPFCEAVGWKYNKLRTELNQERVPFDSSTNDNERGYYTGHEAFSLAIASELVRSLRLSWANACEVAYASSAAKEYLWSSQIDRPYLFLIHGRELDEKPFPSLIAFNRVIDIRKYAGISAATHSASFLHLKSVYDDAVSAADDAGFVLSDWNIYPKDK